MEANFQIEPPTRQWSSTPSAVRKTAEGCADHEVDVAFGLEAVRDGGQKSISIWKQVNSCCGSSKLFEKGFDELFLGGV